MRPLIFYKTLFNLKKQFLKHSIFVDLYKQILLYRGIYLKYFVIGECI